MSYSLTVIIIMAGCILAVFAVGPGDHCQGLSRQLSSCVVQTANCACAREVQLKMRPFVDVESGEPQLP